MLVKPKCVWEAVVCYKIVNKQVQIVNILKKLLPLKHILALSTKSQIYTVSVLQQFTFDNFQSEHPAASTAVKTSKTTPKPCDYYLLCHGLEMW